MNIANNCYYISHLLATRWQNDIRRATSHKSHIHSRSLTKTYTIRSAWWDCL